MEEVVCPICGEKLPNRMRLGSHMWTAHKTKLKQYEAQQAVLYESHTVDGLMKPTVVTESREFVTETQKVNDGLVNKTQTKQDKDIIAPPVRTETVQPQNNMLNEDALVRQAMPSLEETSIQKTVLPEARDTVQIASKQIQQTGKRQMSSTYNPYRELYNSSEYVDTGVMNEYLGR